MWQLVGFMIFNVLLLIVVMSWKFPADKGRALSEDEKRKRYEGGNL